MTRISSIAPRVAVFVDGDNIGSCRSERIFHLARQYGRIDVARCYANAAHANGWMSCAGIELIHAGTGKNAADILLCIDAIETCLDGAYQTVVLATSDGDFVHLARRLRANRVSVIGIGNKTAPEGFRAACTEFKPFADQPTLKPEVDRPPVATKLTEELVIEAIRSEGAHPRGLEVAELNPIMRHRHDVKISEQPEKTWRAYLSKRDNLFDLDKKGPGACVRVRRAASGSAQGKTT